MADRGAAANFMALFYDDRYNETRDRGTLPLYISLDRDKVPFMVGPPAGTRGANVGSGRPGDGPAERSLLRYQPGMKIRWLLQVLPSLRTELVMLLDTDVVWLCTADEIVEKRARLLAEMRAPEGSVILFGERGMWPPYQEFHGVQLRTNSTNGYPPLKPGDGDAFRFLNAGAALGRPQDLLALLRCMERRYEGFPDACPAGHAANGAFRYYAPNRSWVPPQLLVPSRLTKYHGMRLRGSNWGWEQGCFHMYYLEQRASELPAECPRVILDRRARWMLHLAGVSPALLRWSSGVRQASARRSGGSGAHDGGGPGGGGPGGIDSNAPRATPDSRRPRVTLTETGQHPCALHANGPAKHTLQPMWRWWANPSSKPHF